MRTKELIDFSFVLYSFFTFSCCCCLFSLSLLCFCYFCCFYFNSHYMFWFSSALISSATIYYGSWREESVEKFQLGYITDCWWFWLLLSIVSMNRVVITHKFTFYVHCTQTSLYSSTLAACFSACLSEFPHSNLVRLRRNSSLNSIHLMCSRCVMSCLVDTHGIFFMMWLVVDGWLMLVVWMNDCWNCDGGWIRNIQYCSWFIKDKLMLLLRYWITAFQLNLICIDPKCGAQFNHSLDSNNSIALSLLCCQMHKDIIIDVNVNQIKKLFFSIFRYIVD